MSIKLSISTHNNITNYRIKQYSFNSNFKIFISFKIEIIYDVEIHGKTNCLLSLDINNTLVRTLLTIHTKFNQF